MNIKLLNFLFTLSNFLFSSTIRIRIRIIQYYNTNITTEEFDLERREYIKGYVEKNTLIFPTLDLVAKEFSLSLSTLRKKAANEGWY